MSSSIEIIFRKLIGTLDFKVLNGRHLLHDLLIVEFNDSREFPPAFKACLRIKKREFPRPQHMYCIYMGWRRS